LNFSKAVLGAGGPRGVTADETLFCEAMRMVRPREALPKVAAKPKAGPPPRKRVRVCAVPIAAPRGPIASGWAIPLGAGSLTIDLEDRGCCKTARNSQLSSRSLDARTTVPCGL
jgi:hypothetical protein